MREQEFEQEQNIDQEQEPEQEQKPGDDAEEEDFSLTRKSGLAHKKISWNKVSWGAILILMVLLVLKPAYYLQFTWLMIPFVSIMFFYDDFYAMWGMFLFFEENVVIFPGLSMFAVYSFLVAIKYFVIDRYPKKFPVLTLPAILIMLLYAVFAMPNADTTAARLAYVQSGRVPPSDAMINLRLIVGYAIDSIVMIILALRISNDAKIKQLICYVIPISAILSGIFGYTSGNIFIYGGEDAGIVRYMASFNDPNYASFFFNMAIFIVLTNHSYKKLIVKVPLLIVFYYFLVASGSLSGLLFNVLGLFLFSVFKYRLKAIFAFMVIAMVGGASMLAITKIPKLANLPVIVNMQSRIALQFEQGKDTSVSEATSGRETQWKRYWNYFKKQDMGKKLFGGNMIMSYSIDQKFKDEFENAPHQAYISFLLDFGIIGAAVMILFFIIKLINTFIIMCKYKQDLTLFFFITAVMWLFYGMAFDYFGDWRFMMFYFLS